MENDNKGLTKRALTALNIYQRCSYLFLNPAFVISSECCFTNFLQNHLYVYSRRIIHSGVVNLIVIFQPTFQHEVH